MMKELLFKRDLLDKVVSNKKTVTSRLSSNLLVDDIVYVTDSNKDEYYDSLDIFFIVTDVTKKRIRDVDYSQESFTSVNQLLSVLNEIYFVTLKRVDREFTLDDELTVVEFQRVNVYR